MIRRKLVKESNVIFDKSSFIFGGNPIFDIDVYVHEFNEKNKIDVSISFNNSLIKYRFTIICNSDEEAKELGRWLNNNMKKYGSDIALKVAKLVQDEFKKVVI